MSMNAKLLRLIELKTGKPIDQLQTGTISERRSEIEAAKGKPMRLRQFFPFIGRGSVMGDFILPHREVDRQFYRALR
jgi:hypothetical protein